MEDGKLKRLSDYKGEEAIELWANLLDPFVDILSDEKISKMLKEKKPKLEIARAIFSTKQKEAERILLAIDDTPLDGINILSRILSVLDEIGRDPTMRSFFVSQAEVKKQGMSFGSAMENTEESPNISSDM